MIQSGMHGRSINECRSNDCRTVGVMSVGEITVGVMTVGVMTVGVMRRPRRDMGLYFFYVVLFIILKNRRYICSFPLAWIGSDP
jgi:hypothetical protein